jgi:hypothetical protein
MHLLRRLRREQALQRLLELRWWLCAAPDSPVAGMATRRIGCNASAFGQARALEVSLDDVAAHAARIKDIPPEAR